MRRLTKILNGNIYFKGPILYPFLDLYFLPQTAVLQPHMINCLKKK